MKWKERFLSYLSSGWIASGRLFTIISLIILPFIIIILNYFYVQSINSYGQYAILNYDYILQKGEPSFLPLPFLFYGYQFFSYSVLAIILFVYPPYPFPISLGKYFKEMGYDNAVIEYELVKKILYIAVPTFLTLAVILPTITPALEFYSSIKFKTILEQSAFTVAKVYSLLIVFSGLLKIIFALIRKKFRLYFAKGCFLIMSNKKDEVEKMSYFMKGLDSYNSYLRRNLQLQINDLKRIYSKIMTVSPQHRNDLMVKISKFFIDNNLEIDALSPLTELQMEIAKLLKTPISEQFLTKQPLFDKIKDLSTLVATIIPLAISIVELYVGLKR
jgi:hypothetical protein